MFPKTGRKFPTENERTVQSYASAIAEILTKELGNSHHAHKTLMRWTGANERTAKNWLSGSNGPSGEHLLKLMRHSDRVFCCVLQLSGRPVVLSSQRLAEVRDSLQATADLLTAVFEREEVAGDPLARVADRQGPSSAISELRFHVHGEGGNAALSRRKHQPG